MFELRPKGLERSFQFPAEKDVEIVFVRHTMLARNCSRDLNGLKAIRLTLEITAKDNHNLAGVVPWSPYPVVVVSPDGFWQAQGGPK